MLAPDVTEAAKILIDLAFREDLGDGNDVTSESLIDPQSRGKANIVAREPGVACGLSLVPLIIERFGADLTHACLFSDGDQVQVGTVAVHLSGSTIDLLKTERTLLNFLGRLSGISSLTAKFVEQTQGTSAKIFDTRKTTPGWRLLEKYAVTCGGGINHRMGLFDAVLIKDNHLAAVDNRVGDDKAWLDQLEASMKMIRDENPDMMIEVEVDTLEQFAQVLPLKPDAILLDNMTNDQLKTAVEANQSKNVSLEASGGVNLQTVGSIAATGVDRISVGALTHSAVNFDWGLDWDTES